MPTKAPPVSKFAPLAIAASGLIAGGAFALALFMQAAIFPDAVPPYNWIVTVTGRGESRDAALRDLDGRRAEAIAIIRERGIAVSDVASGPIAVSSSEVEHAWFASRSYWIAATAYARFARLSNAFERSDPAGRNFATTFPPIPFARFAVFVLIADLVWLGFLSVAGLATIRRRADVETRSPQGMQPGMIAVQTIALFWLGLSVLLYRHLLVENSKVALGLILAFGFVSLGIWLLRTAPSWTQSLFLRCAFVGYVIALLFTVAAGIASIATPLT